MLTETLFFHERPNYNVEYNLSVGTYAWQAPDAWNLGSGTQFSAEIWLWAGGAGGSSSSNMEGYWNGVIGGGGGGGGGFVKAVVNIVVGQTYTISVGAGGAGNPTQFYAVWNGSGYYFTAGNSVVAKSRGSAGGNSGMSDSLGSILVATGGQPATQRGGYYSNWNIGGVGGSGTINQVSKVQSYTIVNGGRAENGYSGGLGSIRTNVAPVLDQPGGSAIQTSPNGTNYSNYARSAGCGGPSVRANGGRPGNILDSGNSSGNNIIAPGSGGGAGYFAGGDGINTIAAMPWGTNNNNYMGGGKGGDGFFKMSFTVQDGGNAGSAPQ